MRGQQFNMDFMRFNMTFNLLRGLESIQSSFYKKVFVKGQGPFFPTMTKKDIISAVYVNKCVFSNCVCAFYDTSVK